MINKVHLFAFSSNTTAEILHLGFGYQGSQEITVLLLVRTKQKNKGANIISDPLLFKFYSSKWKIIIQIIIQIKISLFIFHLLLHKFKDILINNN